MCRNRSFIDNVFIQTGNADSLFFFSLSFPRLFWQTSMATAPAAPPPLAHASSFHKRSKFLSHSHAPLSPPRRRHFYAATAVNGRKHVTCKATEVSLGEYEPSSSSSSGGSENWVPVVPLAALQMGERRVINTGRGDDSAAAVQGRGLRYRELVPCWWGLQWRPD